MDDVETLSWFQPRPTPSLALLESLELPERATVLDVGGGVSNLVDHLQAMGRYSVTVLDISQTALAATQGRLGARAASVQWICGDALEVPLGGPYDLWHDRAVFHFLTAPEDRARYVERVRRNLRPGGSFILGTFALDGPSRCSGLPVQRHDETSLDAALGTAFKRLTTRHDVHLTPSGREQRFLWSVYLRLP